MLGIKHTLTSSADPLSYVRRMKVLLLLIIPLLLQSRSIVRERNDVIKQALIPTLVNIIGHARMEEHGKYHLTLAFTCD